MHKSLSLAIALAFLAPSLADAAPPSVDLPGGIDLDELGKQHAKKGKKKKKGKAEPETPPPPPPDGDGDGVIDADDKCPEEAEDQDLFEDEDGCPDPDNDGDGINDAQDDCPFEAENVDGWDDDDGCPEKEPAIKPFLIDATLMDGTKVKGKVIRIVATDEFLAANPAAAKLFEVAKIDINDISAQNKLIADGEDGSDDIDRHVAAWIGKNRETYDSWLDAARAAAE